MIVAREIPLRAFSHLYPSLQTPSPPPYIYIYTHIRTYIHADTHTHIPDLTPMPKLAPGCQRMEERMVKIYVGRDFSVSHANAHRLTIDPQKHVTIQQPLPFHVQPRERYRICVGCVMES